MTEETKKLHFTVDGEWLTWILRHCWVEGSEMKAVNIWSASFPHLTSAKHLNGVFIDIVSGKKKFTGNSDGDGFTLSKDGRKYWTTVAGGEPSEMFPLIDSWEDVFLKKKAELFEAELALRWFKQTRTTADTYAGCNYNSLEWRDAAEDNKFENQYRARLSKLWADTRNMAGLLGLSIEIPMLPNDPIALSTKRRRFVSTRQQTEGHKANDLNDTQYKYVKGIIDPIVEHFNKKYKTKMVDVDDSRISVYCGISDIETMNELPDEKHAKPADVKSDAAEYLTSAGIMASPMVAGIKIPTVDDFIKGQMEDQKRETIEPEDASITKWDSGYIDREGRFYGCSFCGHRVFSERLATQLGLFKKTGPEHTEDAETVLDAAGFTKISQCRFYWVHKPNDAQKSVIADFMIGKKMAEAIFNGFKPVSITEGLKDE